MVRRATENDLPRALAIYDSARRFMRTNGNTVQWVNGYPSEALLRQDVARGDLYVMEEDGVVYGVFAFIIGDDPTYQTIHGAWLDTSSISDIVGPPAVASRCTANAAKKHENITMSLSRKIQKP